MLGDVELWSVARPYMYSVDFEVMASGSVDAVTVDTGFKSVEFDASDGLHMNGERVKIRGFCDHDNFGAVGGAVPDRIDLYRAQLLRAVGANAWRMAPTRRAAPPQIMDRLGMLALDENRDYGGKIGQGGTRRAVAGELIDMLGADRPHPQCSHGASATRAAARMRRPPPSAPSRTQTTARTRCRTTWARARTRFDGVADVHGQAGRHLDQFHADNPRSRR